MNEPKAKETRDDQKNQVKELPIDSQQSTRIINQTLVNMKEDVSPTRSLKKRKPNGGQFRDLVNQYRGLPSPATDPTQVILNSDQSSFMHFRFHV
jgi:hypothetical protein